MRVNATNPPQMGMGTVVVKGPRSATNQDQAE